MLTQPLLDKLRQLGLTSFRTALEEQLHSPHYTELSFEERLGLLLDIETTRRANNRLKRRIRTAKFPLQATMEDLDLSARRGLKRAEALQLAQSEWVGRHLNLLVLGPTGAGKTYLACALGRAACQARDLLEILDDRYSRSATLVVTQVPVAEWHSRIPDPTLSDAILDRLIHNAYRLELPGESMRKVHSPLTAAPN